MNAPSPLDRDLEKRIADRLLDVFIRAGLLLALTLLCYRIFAPFLTLMVWAVILAVTLYPLHQQLASRIGRRQGLAATLVVVLGIVLIVAPTAVLMNSLGDSVHGLVNGVRDNTLHFPPPPDSIATWPFVGDKIHSVWANAHADLPAFVQSMQPKIGNLARQALGVVASIGGGLLMFLASFLIAGVIMAFGESGAQASRRIFQRISGIRRGAQFVELGTATIRAVASGVIGVAFIQAIVVGLALLLAGVPWTGALSFVVLVFGIAQVPALLVTLPAIAWIWMGSDHGSVAAVTFTVLLLVAGASDNVLKPLMLGRGVDAPMPVVLLGALGGMAAAGILGMFVGATLLALGYQIFMSWVAQNPELEAQDQPPC